jgi:hypothetical protein
VEEHQHFRQLSVSIEDVLRRILGNVEDPVEWLHPNVRNIEVDSTVFVDDGLADEVGLGLGEGGYLAILDNLIKPLVEFLANIVLDVRVVDFPDSKAWFFCISLDIFNAYLIGNAGILESRIPEEPDYLGQRVPPFGSQVDNRLLKLFAHNLLMIIFV